MRQLVFYYQAVKGYAPITSALAILPQTVLIAPGAAIVGILSESTRRYRWAVWGGWVLTTAGAGVLYLLDRHTTVVAWIFLNFPVSLGAGMLFTALLVTVQAASE